MMKDANSQYIICPYNRECRCDFPKCDKCGWNPAVAERRLKEMQEVLKDE